MKYLLLIAAVGLLACSGIHAENSSQPNCDVVGASPLAECLSNVQALEDKHLNAVYSLIMKMLEAGAVDPTAFFSNKQRDLVVAERAWIRFRDAQCAAEADMLSQASASGTVMVFGQCTLKMTRERMAYLEDVASSLKSDSKLCEKSADACRVK
jgi:uncharacterized protein YecT (DUF1311 family)